MDDNLHRACVCVSLLLHQANVYKSVAETLTASSAINNRQLSCCTLFFVTLSFFCPASRLSSLARQDDKTCYDECPYLREKECSFSQMRSSGLKKRLSVCVTLRQVHGYGRAHGRERAGYGRWPAKRGAPQSAAHECERRESSSSSAASTPLSGDH